MRDKVVRVLVCVKVIKVKNIPKKEREACRMEVKKRSARAKRVSPKTEGVFSFHKRTVRARASRKRESRCTLAHRPNCARSLRDVRRKTGTQFLSWRSALCDFRRARASPSTREGGFSNML